MDVSAQKLDLAAQKMNELSALYALPTIRGMEALGIDAVEVTEHLDRMKGRGELLPCIRIIEFLLKITGQRPIGLFAVMTASPEAMSLFADEFIADCIDIITEDEEV